jgi:hypothetical protein
MELEKQGGLTLLIFWQTSQSQAAPNQQDDNTALNCGVVNTIEDLVVRCLLVHA